MSAPPREGFWQEAFAWQGSVTPLVLPNVIAVGLYALAICALAPYVERLFAFKLQMELDPFGIAGAALSLLLVLRTNAGYDRWWEARKLWGGIVNQTRNLAIEALAYGSSQLGWQERIVRLAAAFPFATKASLRGEALAPDVAELLGDETAARIAQAEHMPSYVSLEIARLLEIARQSSELDSFAFLQLDRERSLLIDHMGGCERILKTPLARVYSIKVRRFIALFLLILPFPLMHQLEYHWMIPIIIMLVAYPLFSLDEIGLELQNPFWEKNLSHLPLTSISRTIKGNLLGLLAQTEAAKSE